MSNNVSILSKIAIMTGIIAFFLTNTCPGQHWYSPYQIQALLTQQPVTLPAIIASHRVPTLNGRGSIFYKISPLAQQFIEQEALPDKTILEIGAGFSNVALQALKHGAGSYVANDMSLEHLKMLVTRITHECTGHAVFDRLLLLHAQAPQELPAISDTYDAILLDKVLHFMNPSEIEDLIAWAKKALKKNGRLYILTVSPYVAAFKDKLLPIYEKKRVNGDLYPGYVEDIFSYAALQESAYPLTFFCKEDLERLFVHHGFIIEQAYTITLPKTDQAEWQIADEKESGLVALVVALTAAPA